MSLDLFGQEVRLIAHPSRGKRYVTGYAAPPGTGRAGETCKTCRYKRTASTGRKSWIKCYHPLAYRSNCTATDIKASAPACKHWERREP